MTIQVQCKESITVRVEAHDPVHFRIWDAFHVLIVDVFSNLRIRPDRNFSRTEYWDGYGCLYVMLETAKANNVPSSSTLPASVK